jgi:hypothetical protein
MASDAMGGAEAAGTDTRYGSEHGRGSRARRGRRTVALCLAGLLACSYLLTVLRPVKASDTGISEIGKLVPIGDTGANPNKGPMPNVPPPMIVDQKHRLGFVVGLVRTVANPDPTQFDTYTRYLVMYDLDSLTEVARIRADDFTSPDIANFSIDEGHEQLFAPKSDVNLVSDAAQCNQTHTAPVFRYGVGPSQKRELTEATQELPCSGRTFVVPKKVSVYVDPADPTHRKLYLTGFYAADNLRHGVLDLENNLGASMVVQQLDFEKLQTDPANALDWEVDLSAAGCGRRDVFLAHRVRDTVVSYCNDAQAGVKATGDQGYVAEIPLAADKPTTIGDSAPITDPTNDKKFLNPLIRRVPALAGTVSPVVDEGSGLLLLITADKVNGDAVWVYDPAQHRFSGVLTGDFKHEARTWHQPGSSISVSGLDPSNGHAYLWGPEGLLVATVRHKPLPPGLIYPLNPHGEEAITPTLAVLAKTPDHAGRLFVPIADFGYEVLEDTTADPPDPPPSDPDQFTSPKLAESDKTLSTFSGSGLASGARLLLAGGVNRAINTKDPGCESAFPPSAGTFFQNIPQWERQILQGFKDSGNDIGGPCFSDVLLSQGNRDLVFAGSSLAMDSDAGTRADAAGLSFGQGDFADPADMERYGLTSPFTPVGCVDEGDKPASTSSPSGGLEGATASSQTSCNGSKNIASSASSVSLPAASGSSLSVGSVSSSISTQPTKDGVLTVAQATAKGITVGPVSVAAVIAQATTKAHGNTDTAHTDYQRQWCGITIAGQGSVPGCIDPDDKANQPFIDQVNNLLGSVRISAPPTHEKATAGGYEGSIVKDPGTQAGDQAVNDDYSPQVPAMQIIRYDDGVEGRNRQVLQLANVEGESHYSILPKPESGEFKDTPPPPTTTEETPIAPPAGPDEVIPGTLGTPGRPPTLGNPAQAAIPFHTTPVVSSRPVLPAPGRSIIERVLRTPGEALKQALELIAENPREFLLLMSMWTLLAGPVYLAQRRRSRTRALVGAWVRPGSGAAGRPPG